MTKSSWLCPAEGDRERLLDMEARLKPVRAASFAVLAVTLLVSGPWLGFWTLLPLAVAVAGFMIVDRLLGRLARPERALAGAWALAQVAIAVSIVLTGGAHSPAVCWLAIPVVTLSARFTTRGVVAGVLLTAALMVAATVGPDPAAVGDDPSRVLLPLALLAGIALLSTALMRSDVQHRTDSVLDGLTSMLNRRALAARVAELEQQSGLTGQPVGVVVGDLPTRPCTPPSGPVATASSLPAASVPSPCRRSRRARAPDLAPERARPERLAR